jgi:hypothetical protein
MMEYRAQIVEVDRDIELVAQVTTQCQTFLEYVLCFRILAPMAGDITQGVEFRHNETLIAEAPAEGQTFLEQRFGSIQIASPMAEKA